ncbi:hypothetical protein [Mycobacteroides franklinii]|uniref:Uncharacterized protein n=1 Tax=Mycobacteroides franklinii TaxID=948102 RepID=A0A4R8QUY4_9MYCO|nr:hypothetical protein [Mycobacteroides franklinii]TDZ46253.1 hypothetical protein CCUG64054_00068 [Mycobacteroides franklinii]TDZ47762.1 hypothetical protein CCUG63697_04052 [Mycobacteroides franklinii]TDZ59970.1 hypothetical protein CCUG63696_00070 [Mycobacteroides franklinii]TDZ65369.1 hypothetical protein CCUG63695_01067 [Mycobacteroides franklinii]TDZ73539.1 hypothetical protein CCUG64056_00068 [Mycobacteroides franklinii]
MKLVSLITAPLKISLAVADTGLAVASKAIDTGREILAELPGGQPHDGQGRAHPAAGAGLVGTLESLLGMVGRKSPLHSAMKVAELMEEDKPIGRALRPGGPVERVMAPGGLADRLTEPGGVLDRLFAKDGPVDRLTSQDGALDRALAPGGLVDQLLAEDGILERLMREEGVLDKFTAKDGPLQQLANLSEVLTKAAPSIDALTPTVELLTDTVSALSSVISPLGGFLPRLRPSRPSSAPRPVRSERVIDEPVARRESGSAGQPD